MAAFSLPASLFANCGTVDVTAQFRIAAGPETLSRDGFLTQSLAMVNGGDPLKGSLYLAVSNLPAGVQAAPLPLNQPRSFTNFNCEPGVTFIRIYLGPQNTWAGGAGKSLTVAFLGQSQPLTATYRIFRGTTMPNLAAVAGDYDGDHESELAVFNKTTATWTIKLSNSQMVTSTVFGNPNDRFVVGDFDGDLKDDLATYQPSTFKWTIRYSSDGSVHTQQFGTPNALPVAADYDGDGYTDIAIYDTQWHMFFVLQSTNGQLHSQTLGQAGDIPVPADYDGDGKADFTVYTPVMKTFKILYSKNNQLFSYGAGDFNGYPFAITVSDPKANPATYDPATGAVTIHQIGQPSAIVRFAGPNAMPVVADFSGDQVADYAGYSFTDAGWAIDTQFFNPNLHPVLALKFGTPNADVPVMTVPSVLF